MCFVVNIAAFTLENRELTNFLKNLDPNDIFDNNIVDVVIKNIFPLVLAVPVSPRGVSGISTCLLQNCWDTIWFVLVGLAGFKHWLAVESETLKTPHYA